MAKTPSKAPGRKMPEVREREDLRSLAGDAGAIHRAVWGNDEADFERMIEYEITKSTRSHIFERKVRRRWKA